MSGIEDRYRQRIIARLDRQRIKGLKKYGVPLEQSKLDVILTLQYMAEELTDALEYIERAIELMDQGRVKQCK